MSGLLETEILIKRETLFMIIEQLVVLGAVTVTVFEEDKVHGPNKDGAV